MAVISPQTARPDKPGQEIHPLSVLLAQRYPHGPLAYLHSYGCQANVADGERIAGLLAELGYGFTQNLEEADFVLYNTCTVRKGAEERVFGNVGALKHYKRRRPDMRIALCGCMMQRPEAAEKIKQSFPHVDIVFGTYALQRLPELIYTSLLEDTRVFDTAEGPPEVIEGLPVRREGKFKAWLPIMYGCDNFCSYCIVPYVRGRERSRKPKDILAEAQSLLQEGYKEITLLGQNVNSYGKGLEENVDFAGLLEKLNALPGEFRIRFMTSHPKDCTPRLLDTLAACEKVCPQLHLPVQSGSNTILSAMNRGYTREQYLALIAYARTKIPEISITSDIIVGFPGEQRQDFLETLSLVKQVGFTSLFTFIYSQRSGTPAASLPDPVQGEEKSRWFRELLALQEQIGLGVHQSYVGKTCRLLVESNAKTPGLLLGRTGSGIAVEFAGDESLLGSFTEVSITGARPALLTGECLQHKL